MKRALLALAIAAMACAATRSVSSPILPVDVRVAAPFRFVGEQKFILREVADVEQMLFADAKNGEVERLFWIQFEQYRPGVDGRYDYGKEHVVTLGGLPFVTNIRKYTTPPDAGSDRAKAFALLAAHGLRVPEGMTRVRLVHVPETDNRREVMIIYAERGLSPDDHDAAVARATALLQITRRARAGRRL